MSVKNTNDIAKSANLQQVMSIFENIEIETIYIDEKMRIKSFTRNFNKKLGMLEDYIGMVIYEIPGFEDFINLKKDIEQVYVTGKSVTRKVTGKETRSFEVKFVPNIISDECYGIFLSVVDITKYDRALKQIEQDKLSFEMLAGFTNSIVWEIVAGSDELKIIKGMDVIKDGEIIKDFFKVMIDKKIVYDEDIYLFENFHQCVNNAEKKFLFEMRLIIYGEGYKWVRVEGKTIYSDEGQPLKIIGKMDDINEEKKNSLSLLEKSQRDPLTALYNKEVTGNLVAYNLIRYSGTGTMFIIDIDKFKDINDKLGHLFGDSVIREMSMRIRKNFRNSDIVGRIGGDEFLVFVPGLNDKNYIEKKATSLNELMRKSYDGADGSYSISGSIGVAVAPGDGEQYEELFKKADAALYKTKEGGRDGYTIFDDSIEIISSEKAGRSSKDTEIRETTLKDNIEPVVGEIVDVFTNTPDSMAAVQHVLYILGEYYNLSRIYVYLNSDGNAKSKRAFSWILSERFSDNNMYDEIDYNNSDDFKKRFNTNGQYYNSMENRKKENKFVNGAKSYFQHAMIVEGQYIGFIVFDDMINVRNWSDLERDTLSVASNLITMTVNNMRSKKMVERETLTLKAISGNQNLYAYMLKPDSYEIVYTSDSIYKRLSSESKKKKMCYDMFKGRDVPCTYCPLKSLDKADEQRTIEYFDEKSKCWFRATANKTKIGDDEITLICFTDVTEFVDIVLQTDKLTGILSFHGFKSILAQREDELADDYMIVYINVSKFKNINSTYGFEGGDTVLKLFAECASDVIAEDELICRIAEDKFAALLRRCDKAELDEKIGAIEDYINAKVQQRLGKMAIQFLYGVYEIRDGNTNVSTMVDNANAALKTIKDNALTRVAWYNNDIEEEILKIKKIEDVMEQALEDEEFIVYYQGKVNLSDEKVAGAEALIRWKSADGKLIPPNSFIPIFEKNGFVVKLDFYVYESVLKQIRKWLDRGIDVKPISVNVSRIHMKDETFLDRLVELVEKYDVPTNLFELELTENIFMQDFDEVLEIVKKIKSKGFLFSIDDFGAGFSSLNLIKDLPVDIIKLDKGFFGDGENMERERVILKHVIEMAKDLQVKVIAEGVETREQVEFLKGQGCGMVQGYYYFKPVPVEDFEKFLE